MITLKINTKMEVTETGCLLETVDVKTLNFWVRRLMVWIDNRTIYTFLTIR